MPERHIDGERVLVVHDQVPVARTRARWFERAGFGYAMANSPEEAGRVAAGETVGVLLARMAS